MAQPSTQLTSLRNTVTKLMNTTIPDLAAAVALIDGAGDTDSQRAAFFQQAIEVDEGNDDITVAEFNAAALAVRAIQTAFDDNLQELYTLRR